MGDGTKEKPLTRKDVLRLIKENGGTAEGLDLSGKVFAEAIDLRGLDLSGIILARAVFQSFSGESLIRNIRKYIRLEKDGLPYEINRGGANFEEANLSGADFEKASLANAHLERSCLINAYLEEAVLTHAHLEKANLRYANLEKAKLLLANLKEADLYGANLGRALLVFAQLEEADLEEANLEGTLLFRANLKGAYLYRVKLSSDTALQHVDWGDLILGDDRNGQFRKAVDTYRQLKTWYTEHGIYDRAGEFFFREMTVKRKMLQWWPNPFPRAWSKFLSLICGYGERPLRVIGWAASVVSVLALIYFVIGSMWEWKAFWNSLYFSAVSFTALGYGSWVEISNDWIKGIGAFESFIGVFTIALFLVTFVRKMTR